MTLCGSSSKAKVRGHSSHYRMKNVFFSLSRCRKKNFFFSRRFALQDESVLWMHIMMWRFLIVCWVLCATMVSVTSTEVFLVDFIFILRLRLGFMPNSHYCDAVLLFMMLTVIISVSDVQDWREPDSTWAICRGGEILYRSETSAAWCQDRSWRSFHPEPAWHCTSSGKYHRLLTFMQRCVVVAWPTLVWFPPRTVWTKRSQHSQEGKSHAAENPAYSSKRN